MNIYDFSSIKRELRSFTYVHSRVKEMEKKKCCTCEVFFFSLLSPVDYFAFLVAVTVLIAVTG